MMNTYSRSKRRTSTQDQIWYSHEKRDNWAVASHARRSRAVRETKRQQLVWWNVCAQLHWKSPRYIEQAQNGEEVRREITSARNVCGNEKVMECEVNASACTATWVLFRIWEGLLRANPFPRIDPLPSSHKNSVCTTKSMQNSGK